MKKEEEISIDAESTSMNDPLESQNEVRRISEKDEESGKLKKSKWGKDRKKAGNKGKNKIPLDTK